mgnify:CR=1 FL=1
MSKIFIYSVPRPSAYGIHDWTNDSSGVKLKKTKLGRTKTIISALYSPKVGGLANYISYTPWMEDGKQVTDSDNNPLTLQDKLERKWNKPKGYFSNKAFRKGDSLNSEDMTYFQKMAWSLEDGATVIDTDKMDDEMFYYTCLASPLVANSEREWRSHKWPKAEFYIALENESEEIKYSRANLKGRAYAALADTNLTDEERKRIACVLGLISTKSNPTTQNVYNSLFENIEKSEFTETGFINKFLVTYTLLQSPNGRTEFNARYFLQQALDRKIVYERQGTYVWNRPNSPMVIGERLSEALDFILSPKKAIEVEEIEKAIQAS